MWKELVARGIRVGKERVRKLMQRHGIKARGKRKFVVHRQQTCSAIAPDLLARNFTPEAPDQVWTSERGHRGQECGAAEDPEGTA
ncbi:MAG: hypothetical protein H0X13_16400 [Ramlibacter sp.]|nr:hypothetical protein [Ramlibacter sp.]